MSWNHAATTLFGWAPGEVLGRELGFLNPARLAASHADKRAETLVHGRAQRLETVCRRKDGSEVRVHLAAFPLRDGNGELVGGATILRDVTGERAAERTRLAAEANYRALFETMSDGVVLQNACGEVVSFNRRALEILHLSQDELLGAVGVDPRWQPVREDGTPFPPEERPPAVALRTGLAVSDVVVGVPTESGHTWVLVNARPLRGEDERISGVVVTFADITAVKSATDALREDERRFRAALSLVQTGVWISDGVRLQFVNDALCSMLGYSREELLAMGGMEFATIIDPDDLRLVLERGQARLAGREVTPVLEVHATTRDGRRLLLELRGTVLRHGPEPQLLVAVHDVTERATESQLKDELLALLAHELRTPLTTLSGNSEMLGRLRLRLPSHAADAIQDIEADAFRLQAIVENMLVLGRSGRQPELEPVMVQRLLVGVVARQQSLYPDQRIEWSAEPDLPPVLGNAGYIAQVLMNLLSNAAKYGGPRPVELATKRGDGDTVVIRVADHGRGLDETTAARIFEPFYRSEQVPDSAHGLGLGLTVVRRLVEAQQGTVRVATTPGGGATFEVQLPILSELAG